ncbi:hypothetical protein HanIR_Chr12g0591391 [Helianthus annuus]|nr:hypothetical protein HanIR_Chr12g0591391 [Helianthus annuus]
MSVVPLRYLTGTGTKSEFPILPLALMLYLPTLSQYLQAQFGECQLPWGSI